MDPWQTGTWTHLGHTPDGPAPESTVPTAPDVTVEAAVPASPPLPKSEPAGEPGEQRGPDGNRRRFDRGGRRRSDWPEDAGMTCCPGCGFESIQSLGALDSGDYLWQCPHCDRRFQTGRATRALL